MSRSKRLSFSSIAPVGFGPESPLRSPPIQAVHQSAEEWRQWWDGVYARDLVDLPVELVDANTAVDEACDLLLHKDISCIAVRSEDGQGLHGLFDFADVNAFLTLAATQHTLSRDELNENPRADRILIAARSGKVPVHLVSNLSDKNSMEVLPNNSTLLSLLAVFSRGTHRVLIRSDTGYAGFVTDGATLAHITSRGSGSNPLPSLSRYLTNPLFALQLPSTQLYSGVVSVTSNETVLDAMKKMSEDGVSSVAVLDDGSGRLLSAVSVTDVGKIVLPTQSNHILTTEMSQMVTLIRSPLGSTDGVEHYPVYSIALDSSLSYMVQKLIATNSHRLFVTDSPPGSESPSVAALENLCGVVSIVDILALFARIAQVPGVDPLQAQTRRRMSTSSSRSSRSGSSRSSSRSRTSTRVRVDSTGLSPSVGIGIPIPLARSGASPASHSPSRGVSGSPRVPR